MKTEFTTSSNKYKHKEKNGDNLGVFSLENENITLFLLADGVGGSVGDWKASRTCVDLFYKVFENNKSEKNIIKRISNSIEEVNKNILLEAGYFKGMKATFIILVIEANKKLVHYTSIGDSRIYKISQSEVSQLSKDQVKVVVRRKKDGTPYTQNGSIINAQGVTHVMGAQPLMFQVDTISVEDNISFLMASDGFYSKIQDLERTLQNIANQVDLSKVFKQLVNIIAAEQDDDASAIFIRFSKKSNAVQISLDDIFKEETTKFSKLEINNAICIELSNAIERKEIKLIQQLIEHITKHNILLSFDFYNEAIKLLIRLNITEGDIYQQLVSLLKKSRI